MRGTNGVHRVGTHCAGCQSWRRRPTHQVGLRPTGRGAGHIWRCAAASEPGGDIPLQAGRLIGIGRDSAGLLVKPDLAEAQMKAELPPPVLPPSSVGGQPPPIATGGQPGGGPSTLATSPKGTARITWTGSGNTGPLRILCGLSWSAVIRRRGLRTRGLHASGRFVTQDPWPARVGACRRPASNSEAVCMGILTGKARWLGRSWKKGAEARRHRRQYSEKHSESHDSKAWRFRVLG